MKTAKISIPDALFRAADRLAYQKKVSRSQLYARAVEEYLSRHKTEAIIQAVDAVSKELPKSRDKFVRAASRRILEQTE